MATPSADQRTATSAWRGFLRAFIPAVLVAAVVLFLGACVYWIRWVDFMWGPYWAGGLFAGMGGTFMLGLWRGWTWVEQTPVFKHWALFLGNRIAKPVLFVLMLLMFIVGVVAVLLPAIMGKSTYVPQPKNYSYSNKTIIGDPAKSWSLLPSDPKFYDTVMEDYQSTKYRRNAIVSMVRAISDPRGLRKDDFRAFMLKEFKTGDDVIKRLLAPYLQSFCTKEHIPDIKEVMRNTTDESLKAECETTLRFMR